MPKEPTMEKFYAHYPEYRKYPLPQKTFSWIWYYAMQQMGDDESRQDAQDLKTKLRQREVASSSIALLIPTLHTQLVFNDLAESGLKNQLNFLEAVEAFHEKNRLYFYPKIFAEQAVKTEN